MDDSQIGLLLILPTHSVNICRALEVPEQLRGTPLIAILVPWKLTVEQYQKYEWQDAHGRLRPYDGEIAPELVDKLDTFGERVTTKSEIAQALRLFHFTAADQDFFKRSARRFCVWHSPADGRTTNPGFETKLLLELLGAWKAQNVGFKQDVRVIFVHVGAISSLHKLEAIALRRSRQPELRIYSYGTHPSVHPSRWGVRELYPVGAWSYVFSSPAH